MNGDNVTEEKKETKALCADTIPLRISEMGQDIKFQRMIEWNVEKMLCNWMNPRMCLV